MTSTSRSNFSAMLRTTVLLVHAHRLARRDRVRDRRLETALLFLGIAAVMNLGAYWFSDKIALKMSGAKPISEQEAPGLYQMVRELTTRAGMPMPTPPHDPQRAAERVRDRPQPGALGGRRHPGHHQAALARTSCAA